MLPEVLLYGPYNLVVVVSYSLELAVEFPEPDVIVHGYLVYLDHLELP